MLPAYGIMRGGEYLSLNSTPIKKSVRLKTVHFCIYYSYSDLFTQYILFQGRNINSRGAVFIDGATMF